MLVSPPLPPPHTVIIIIIIIKREEESGNMGNRLEKHQIIYNLREKYTIKLSWHMGKCILDGDDDDGGGLVWFLCSNTYKFSCFFMFPLFFNDYTGDMYA